jgi:hypothetical protein
MGWRALAIGLLWLCTMPALAQVRGQDPFVFVGELRGGARPDPANTAWHLRPMSIRPTGKSVGGFSLAAINAARALEERRRKVLPAGRWCFANALSERSYSSPSPAVQREIARSFRDNPQYRFALRGRFTGAGEMLALVGHFQACGGKIGSFILVIDRSGARPRIAYVDALPYESGLQIMRLVNGNITISTCFACGDVTGLFYDARRRRWYWDVLGE